MPDTQITVTTDSVPDGTPVELRVGPPVNRTYTDSITNSQSIVTILAAHLTAVDSAEVDIDVKLPGETLSTKVNIIPVDGVSTATLADFNMVVTESPHDFIINDPYPLVGRRYDISINGVDQGSSIVYPVLTFTASNYPTDGTTLNVLLKYWDNDDYASRTEITGIVYTTANPSLVDFGTTLDGSTHTFTVIDPVPVAGRRYDVYIAGQPSVANVVYPTQTQTHTGLPVDGRSMTAELRSWDNDDFGTVVYNTGTVNAFQPAGAWDNTLDPSVAVPLSNPIVIRGWAELNAYQTAEWPQTANKPPGLFTYINLSQNQDLLIDMRGEQQSVSRPIRIVGRGRNVAIVGIDFLCVTAPSYNGAPSGDIGNYEQDQGRRSILQNTHPRSVALLCIEVRCEAACWIEGAYMDVAGHDSDAFVLRSAGPSGQTPADASSRRKNYIVNTRARGMEGNVHGYHGDFFQNQGSPSADLKPGEESDSMNSMFWENVTSLSAYNHVTHHSWDGHDLQDFMCRRCYFDFDPIYSDDQNDSGLNFNTRPDPSGGPIFSFHPMDVDPTTLNIDQVYYRSPGYQYWAWAQNKTRNNTNDEKIYANKFWNGDPIPTGSQNPSGGAAHPGLFMIDGGRSTFRIDNESSGGHMKPVDSIPATQFSPRDQVGKYYSGPFNAYWDTF